VFETALSNYEAYVERLTRLAAHRHSHITLRVYQHCKHTFGHFARTASRGLGRAKGYGDTVETILERADNATLSVAAEMFGYPPVSLPRKNISEMSFTIRFGGMGVGDMIALADAAHVGAVGLAVLSAICFLIAQDARVHEDSCCKIPMVGTTMDTSVRCTPGESWPYYLANSGCSAGARCSGSTGVYI
jgi:hypothetical protein